ncbi:hypothetical protein G9P44_000413 [Scheffersomyces stipitis]|nr:hypothetical protein G9P44_000413 [Scheffersomyces stipitis]
MSEERSITDLFLDQTFKLYKCNQSLVTISASTNVLAADQVAYLKENIAKYLYSVYRRRRDESREGEIIPRYSRADDIEPELKITFGSRNTSFENRIYNIQYLIIRTSDRSLQLPRQIFIFINRDGVDSDGKSFNTIVLNRQFNSSSSSVQVNNFIISLLENMPDIETGLVMKEYRLNEKYIETAINELSNSIKDLKDTRVGEEVRLMDGLLGDLEITYSSESKSSTFSNGPVINGNLRNIVINIPQKDITEFINKFEKESEHGEKQTTLQLISEINGFLYDNSSINFENLAIVKFVSSVVNISAEGKIKISGAKIAVGDESVKDRIVWFLLESLYNEKALARQ